MIENIDESKEVNPQGNDFTMSTEPAQAFMCKTDGSELGAPSNASTSLTEPANYTKPITTMKMLFDVKQIKGLLDTNVLIVFEIIDESPNICTAPIKEVYSQAEDDLTMPIGLIADHTTMWRTAGSEVAEQSNEIQPKKVSTVPSIYTMPVLTMSSFIEIDPTINSFASDDLTVTDIGCIEVVPMQVDITEVTMPDPTPEISKRTNGVKKNLKRFGKEYSVKQAKEKRLKRVAKHLCDQMRGVWSFQELFPHVPVLKKASFSASNESMIKPICTCFQRDKEKRSIATMTDSSIDDVTKTAPFRSSAAKTNEIVPDPMETVNIK